MTNDETAFREIEQAIAEDQQLAFFRKFGPAVIGGAAAIVFGVGGWQFWQMRQAAAAQKAAAEFKTATETLTSAPEDGWVALEAFSAEAPRGYAVLADMRRAASLAGAGKREEALAVLRDVYAAGGTPKRLRELARLRAAALALADGRDAVLNDLGDLAQETSAMGHYAREMMGIAALEATDFESALSIFRNAADDVAAPEPLRQRAAELAALAAAAKSGVNLTGEARLEDLAKALDAAAGAAGQGAEAGLSPDPSLPPAEKTPGDASQPPSTKDQ